MTGYVLRVKERAIGLPKRLRIRELSGLSSGERSQERYRRVALGALTAVGARGLGVAVTFITVPLTLRYLGAEQYGLWLTITSIATLLLSADLGLSMGLVSGISSASGGERDELVQQLVASAFYLLVLIAAAFGACFAVLYPTTDWGNIFNVDSPQAADVAGPAVLVFVTLTLIRMPLGLGARIRTGFQEGFIASAWTAVGSLVALVALVVAIGMEANLPWLIFALTSGPLAAAVLNIAGVFRSRPSLIPRPSNATANAGCQLLRLGVLFFVLQVTNLLSFQLDNLVVARILGAAAVTQYAVPMKLFMLIPTVAGFALTPLWPAYREALARGDYQWFTRAFRRSSGYAAGLGLGASLVLLPIAPSLIRAWAGPDVTPSTSLLVALTAYSAMFTFGPALGLFFYAVNSLRFMAVNAIVLVVLNLIFSIILTRSIGLSGPAWGSVLSFLPVMVSYLLYIGRYLRRFPDERVAQRAAPSTSDRGSENAVEAL